GIRRLPSLRSRLLKNCRRGWRWAWRRWIAKPIQPARKRAIMTRVNKVVMVRGFVCCVLVIVARPQMSVAEYDLSSISLAQTNGSMTGSRLESEQLAMELVEAHLPELKTVLASLKKHSHKEYQKAVSDLARTSRRLETL